MGSATPAKLKRNIRIFLLFKKGKATRDELMVRYNISQRRFYQIIQWAAKTTPLT